VRRAARTRGARDTVHQGKGVAQIPGDYSTLGKLRASDRIKNPDSHAIIPRSALALTVK
jgi:hypothetical protein